MRPFWTWRPGRKWCEVCGRWRPEHRHVTDAMVQSVRAFFEYGAAMERVRQAVGMPTSSLKSLAESFEAIVDRENQDTSPDP